MRKQPEITAATRNAFVDAFCKLYIDTPIEKISIKRLTDLAGYNRATFYNYFNDVYALLTYIEDFTILIIKENVVTNIKINHLEQDFIQSFLKLFDGCEQYVKILTSNPNNSRFADRLKSEMLFAVTDAFGLPQKNIKSIYVLDFYFSGLIAMMTRYLKNNEDITILELSEMLKGFLFHGILPQLKNIK